MRKTATTILLALCLLACGVSARQKAVATALTSANIARDSFIVFDAKHQADIVASATSRNDGLTKLEEYREKRVKVVTLFEVLYRSIAIGAVLQKDPAALGNIARAAALLYDAIRDLSKGALP